MSSTPNALRYVGDGSLTVRGVPPRDLSEADLAVIGPVNTQRALMSPLYEATTKAEAEKINTAAAPDPTTDEGDGTPGDTPTAGKDR